MECGCADASCTGCGYGEAHPQEQDNVTLQGIISDISYKPGWHFSMEYNNAGAAREADRWHSLVISAEVLHSATFEPVTFVFRRIIPRVAQVDVTAFLSWAEDVIAEAEIHEMREFFRYKGELVNDPHKPVLGGLADGCS